LRLGASTTIAQYVLPNILASFHKQYPDIQVNLFNGNTQQIESELLQKNIELGIIEGRSKKREFKYIPFLKDDLVLITKSDHPIAKKGEISLEELQEVPVAIREFGSGTLQVLRHYLKNMGLRLTDLNIQLVLGNTRCFTFLSLNSVLNELHRNERNLYRANENRHYCGRRLPVYTLPLFWDSF